LCKDEAELKDDRIMAQDSVFSRSDVFLLTLYLECIVVYYIYICFHVYMLLCNSMISYHVSTSRSSVTQGTDDKCLKGAGPGISFRVPPCKGEALAAQCV
jgi:hypothetical protein